MKVNEAIERQKELEIKVIEKSSGAYVWNGDSFDYLLSCISGCTPNQADAALAVLQRLGQLETEIIYLKAEVTALHDGPRCCGHQWRNKSGRLYMHHSLNETCPMHGPAPAGADRGLRSYVKAEDEESTIKAAADFEQWKIRKADLKKTEQKLSYLVHQLTALGNGRAVW